MGIRITFRTLLMMVSLCAVGAAQNSPDVRFYSLEKEYRTTLTYVYKVRNTDALELKQIVRDMLSIYGSLYVNEDTEELYITDVPEKIEDLKQVLPRLDVEGLEAGNNLASRVVKLRHVTAPDVLEIVRHKLSPEGHLFEVPYLNALTITDVPSKIDELTSLLDSLDTPAPHISVKITVVEFNNEEFNRLGINIFGWLQGLSIEAEGHGDNPGDVFGMGSIGARSRHKERIHPPLFTKPDPAMYGKKRYHVRADFTISDIVAFICENGDGDVLADTRLVTRNNKYALINAGELIPVHLEDNDIWDRQPGDAYRKTGVTVHVTPNVQEDSLINLKLSPRIADLTGWSPKGEPIVFERALQTEVNVRNNSVFVLGGLKRREYVEKWRGVPVLKDIPVLRYLFSVKKEVLVEREVLIFIRPSTDTDTEVSAEQVDEALRRFNRGKNGPSDSGRKSAEQGQ